MKKYRVTYYFTTFCEVEVEAEDKVNALEKAAYEDINEQLIQNAVESDKPDVELITEE